MGILQLPEQSLNPKPISKREFDDNGDASVVAYNEWLTMHQSALYTFEQMMKIAKKKQIVVFLDYDGTLSPIVNDPEKAFITDKMRSTIHEVAKCFPTAIVTGRARDKAVEFVKLKDLCYAGSHGMHISIPSGFLKSAKPEDQTHIADEQGFINFYAAKKFSYKLKKIKEKLLEKTKGIRGAIVEDNKFCISVHFRCVDDELVDNVKKIVDSVIESYPEFRAGEGKMVMEVRPNIEWNKGHALGYLLNTFGFDAHNDDVLPLYIGDDLTDEDAFKFIKKLGRGFSIVVSSMPKKTDASFSLRDTIEVMDFLTKLTGWRKSSSSD
ncbi:probable trehalose-phosphate phosphatase J [Corylus avellana]|uniref:probable trehalose-phosphate phosphatase J n=1 Tax=Corylus avellana TaxID=13451 RepID=UPI00286C72C6|nr:probable trehalose-phosphate phosphatase J [Corylus avellana]XP_059449572.1 probable trehalose-phosphate phosphatase J [Corylus avellana]XP_059449573.1 probable trehalose-phosphate phosphatase J [Corylus avellana]XP_059449574.1 probable trehalose-phosphate phosphatase J [Corylus avellana]